MAVLNSTIVERAWLEGSNDFQQRTSNPSIYGLAAFTRDVFDPYNNDLYNQFTGLLYGTMGTYVDGKRFLNPLRDLKRPMEQGVYGNVERHIAVQYMHSHSYKADSETLLKYEAPEFVEWFYSTNRKENYRFSWARNEIELAFSREGYGFNELLARTLDQQISSDEYDEMNYMIQCFAEADQRWGGLYRHQLSAAPTNEATAKELLRAVRTVAGQMRFPTTHYNHIPVPVFETDPSQLIFWVTPEVRAVLDVDALSALFNIDRADIQYRIIEIPQFPIPNVYAALTSVDFIYARDRLYGVYPEFFNTETLTQKFYLHHWSIIGANPAANCVLFSTDANTAVIPTIQVEVESMAFNPAAVNVELGGTVQLNLELRGTVTGNGGAIAVEPDAATYEITATRAGDDGDVAVPLNRKTFVDSHGKLHVQKTGLQVGDIITVLATSAYINPSGETSEYTATATATVTNAADFGYKETPVDIEPYIDYSATTDEQDA